VNENAAFFNANVRESPGNPLETVHKT